MPSPEPVAITPAVLRAWPLPRPGDDKESRGRVLVVGGSDQTPGAVLLAAEAALRSGAGKLQVATVASLAPHVATALPEARVVPLPQTPQGHISRDAAEAVAQLGSSCDAVLIGPGLRDVSSACELVGAILPQLGSLTVLDALAIAYLDDHREALHHLAGRAVLTPNFTELAHTLGTSNEEVDGDPAAAVRRLASSASAVVCGGGPTSWVAEPGGSVWHEDGGGPGLGVSGSGDVKAGIVVGLAARGAEPAQAAVWAEHLHAQAGDRLAADIGPLGFLARELPPQLPRVLAELEA